MRELLSYCKETYNNTIFHRVINRFMIQGRHEWWLEEKITKEPIKNEANNG